MELIFFLVIILLAVIILLTMQNTGVPSLINSVFHFLNIRKKNANTNNDHNAELLQKESQSQSQRM